jgi:hypothetical protein
MNMRRRLDLERISNQILVALHERFFDDEVAFSTFSEIRNAILDQPANAIRLQLTGLITARDVIQQTEQRERSFPQRETYSVNLDGYKITRRGIEGINKIDDEEYGQIQASLNLNTATAEKAPSDWEPIPLNREEEKQKAAVEKLDEVIEELRGDNGYATSNPEEKVFVQDKLAAVSKRLKEDSHISWMYLREFVFAPLTILIKRFGGAAVGVAAVAAKEAFTSWLKGKGISILDGMFK